MVFTKVRFESESEIVVSDFIIIFIKFWMNGANNLKCQNLKTSKSILGQQNFKKYSFLLLK